MKVTDDKATSSWVVASCNIIFSCDLRFGEYDMM